MFLISSRHTTTRVLRQLSTAFSYPKWSPPSPPLIPALSSLLGLPPGPPLQAALDRSGISPDDPLLLQPEALLTLFHWAQQPTLPLLNLTIEALCEAGKYDSVWGLLLRGITDKDAKPVPDADTFDIIITRYARAGIPLLSVQTYEFASRLEIIPEADLQQKMFGVLLGFLCKEGHMRVAMDYFNYLKYQGKTFVSSTLTYNMLLNGWFRCKNLDEAERLWTEMKMENVEPTVVTYGIVVEGLCRMRRVETAINLVHELKSGGIEPNVIVYNPIIHALGEAGRIKDALRFMERCSVLKCGPTISTYNSLVNGFCKAEDIEGAGKILKKMISKGCIPTLTTYNYFFKYFSKTGKLQEGLNLHTKLMDSGYAPDRLTYRLLVKMLCEQERLDSAIQLTKEMRDRGYDMDSAICTRLIHLMCKMHRFDDALEGFEYMIQRGIVPQYQTFEMLTSELENRGLTAKMKQLFDLMGSVPHGTEMSYIQMRREDRMRESSILHKARAVSDILEISNMPRELVKRRISQ